MAGRFAASERLGRPMRPLPHTTALGALINHITGGHIETIDEGPRSFQPMNVNFGLFPPLAQAPKAEDGKRLDRKSTRLNSSHANISYAVFCLKKKKRLSIHLIIIKNHK